MIFKKMFSRAWILATIFVLLGSALCIRLGIWQLDRLEQRRVFNAQVITMRAAEMLDLNKNFPPIFLRWNGVLSLSPVNMTLRIKSFCGINISAINTDTTLSLRFFSDGGAVLVDRGWIPAEGNSAPALDTLHKYDEAGTVTVTGQIRLGQDKPAFGGVADPPFTSQQPKLEAWNNLNVERIAEQSPYPILTVYIQPNATENDFDPPIPSQPEVDLTEGSHFGYALQWFTFASILFFGYPFFLRKQDS